MLIIVHLGWVCRHSLVGARHLVIPITAKIIGGRKDIWCWVSFSQMYLSPSNHQDVLLKRGWRGWGLVRCAREALRKSFFVCLRSITIHSFISTFSKKLIQNVKGCLLCWHKGIWQTIAPLSLFSMSKLCLWLYCGFSRQFDNRTASGRKESIQKQARKLQATLDGCNPKLCPLTYSLTHRGKV